MSLPSNLPGLNFQLGEDIDALRDAVRDFAQSEIAPRAAEIDRTDQFPMDLWRRMGDLGVLGITVPEQYGGAAMGYLAHMVVTIGQRLQRRAAALVQGVEQHLPHRLRPQHPGVVGLVHQIDQSLGGAEHFF